VRFRELRLTAFGPFTDQVIDFGDPGPCDLHVVLGLNEAGKSSALRAIHALLFGFPHSTPDAHLHPYERLRVGALLDTIDDQRLEIARVKARQRDLRDANDEPLEDGELRHALGGVDEALYRRLFLVDHAELREGGSGLVVGGGDFGVSLFGATLGTGNLATVRKRFLQRGDELFKADGKARKPRLNAALLDYRQHLDQARSLSVKPSEYEAAVEEVTSLAEDRVKKTDEVAQLEREERTLTRLASITGPMARRTTVLASLEPLSDVPVLAHDATTQREVALENQKRATGQLDGTNSTLKELRTEIGQVEVPAGLLKRSPEIQALAAKIDTHEKALGDRANRSRELEPAKRAVVELRERLGNAAPEDPAPVDHTLRTRIADLGDEQVRLLERKRVADENLTNCKKESDRVEKALSRAATPPGTPDAIDACRTAAARQVPLALAANQQKKNASRELAKLVAAAAALSPPFDPGAPLPAKPPAAAVIAAHQQKVQQLDEQLDEQRKERDRLASRRNELHLQLAKLGAEEVETARHQMLATRSRRDETYTELGSRLAEADLHGARHTHTELGSTLTQADDLADGLLTQADRVAQRGQLTAELTETNRQHGQREAEITKGEERSEQLHLDWHQLWQPCGIAPLDDAGAMHKWRARCDEIIEQHTDLTLQLGEHKDALDFAAQAADSLRAALKAAGSPADADLPLEELVEFASQIVKRTNSAIDTHQQLATAATEAKNALTAAKHAVEQAESNLTDWSQRWEGALRPLGLPGDTAPAEARDTIARLDELAVSHKTVEDLHHRIERINSDYNSYADDVKALAATLAPELQDTDALQLIRTLSQRLQEVTKAATKLSQLKDREDAQLERIRGLEEELRVAQGQLSRLCEQAQCSDPEALPAIEARAVERDELRRERLELEKRIVEQGEQPVAELQDLLGSRTGDDLAAELATHRADLQSARDEFEALVERHTKAKAVLDDLDHGTEAAHEREQAEHAAALTGDLAEQYLTERAAAILLTRSIAHHREHSATPILARAEELLPQLTAHSLTRLFVDDQDSDQPVLMARRANGGELDVNGMSDGALDQLYLALRLAALEHHLDALPPLPLLLDDILVNFDENRVATTVPAFAQISQRTQVIVLTHHQHVAAIAQDTLGDRVRVHVLETSAGT
jgi:uncharacterized protein YhaN